MINIKEVNQKYNILITETQRLITEQAEVYLKTIKEVVRQTCPHKVGEDIIIPKGYPGANGKRTIKITEVKAEINEHEEVIEWVLIGSTELPGWPNGVPYKITETHYERGKNEL